MMRFVLIIMWFLCFLSLIPSTVLAREPKQKRKENANAVRELVLASFRLADARVIGDKELVRQQSNRIDAIYNAISYKLKSKRKTEFEAKLKAFQSITSPSDAVDIARKEFVDYLVETFEISPIPAQNPELEVGRRVYLARCAVCHDAKGTAESALANKLNPKPKDLSRGRLAGTLSPFRTFNALLLGVPGTSMDTFDGQLTDHELWSVAFYTQTLAVSLPDKKIENPKRLTLYEISLRTNPELLQSTGKKQDDDWINFVRLTLSFDPSISRQ
jgi:mono/diheme cytochrome c family protein